MYDLEAIFTELNVRFWTSGKNCSPGWVNIQCPFCDDHSNHMGVALDNGGYHCWKCDTSGALWELISEISNIPKAEQSRLLKESHSNDSPQRAKRGGEEKEITDILPGCLPELPELHSEYLKERGFDPNEIVRKYRVLATHFFGKWRGRLIVPVIYNGVAVNFTGMDVTGTAEEKYKHCPNERALMDMKRVLYNFDTVQDRAIICEGVTDVWRMGDGSTATFGTQFTERQLQLISRRVKHAFILFDSDAHKKGERLGYQLSGIINHVEQIKLPSGDPADLSPAMVRKIRRWVYG